MQIPRNTPSLTPRFLSRELPLSRGLGTHALISQSDRAPRYQTSPAPRRTAATIIRMPAEPDDAQITGATRSLSRRLLALNIRYDA